MKKLCSLLLIVTTAILLLGMTVWAAVADTSAQDNAPAAEAAVEAAAGEASVEAPIQDSAAAVEAAADEAVSAANAEPAQGESAEGESSGENAESAGESAEGESAEGAAPDGTPDFNSPSFNPDWTEKLNVISSAVVFPLCFLSIILWFFRAFGMTFENKNNGWLKVYKVLRKIHIPVGAATVILGLYHTIKASISHGFSVNWGSAAMFFFLLGFVCWLLRKQLKRHWLVLHRFTTLIATICMMIHCAPYLKIVFTVVLPAILKKL